MTDARALVPKDKCDGSHIEELKRLSDGEIEPILPRLLAWIQDVNWPVAAELLPVLAQRQTALLPLIREILRAEETDDVWKYWILTSLAPLFSEESVQSLRPALERIVTAPTRGEIEEEVTGAAAFLLRKRKGRDWQPPRSRMEWGSTGRKDSHEG